jgi:hypothetical protein
VSALYVVVFSSNDGNDHDGWWMGKVRWKMNIYVNGRGWIEWRGDRIVFGGDG